MIIGDTPFQLAVKADNLDLIRFFLKQLIGYDHNAGNCEELMFCAAKSDSIEAVLYAYQINKDSIRAEDEEVHIWFRSLLPFIGPQKRAISVLLSFSLRIMPTSMQNQKIISPLSILQLKEVI